jgi:hypothetical protein
MSLCNRTIAPSSTANIQDNKLTSIQDCIARAFDMVFFLTLIVGYPISRGL